MIATPTPQHYFAAPTAGVRLRAARAARRAWPVPLNVGLKLARHEDRFVVTAATPGVKADHIQLALVGSRQLQLQILQPQDLPTPQASTTSAADAATGLCEGAPESANADVASIDAPGDGSVVEASTLETSEVSKVDIPASAPYYAGDSPTQQGSTQTRTDMVVILEKWLMLPQLVDDANISCTYADGLVRIEIPIVDPAPNEEIVKLQHDLSEAAAQLAAFEKQVQEQREKVQSAHAALRKAKSGSALSRRAQRLTLNTEKGNEHKQEP